MTRRASGRRASTSGQAASSRSTPLLTMSLPTKATSGSRPGAKEAGGRAGPGGARRPAAGAGGGGRAAGRGGVQRERVAARRRRLGGQQPLRQPVQALGG